MDIPYNVLSPKDDLGFDLFKMADSDRFVVGGLIRLPFEVFDDLLLVALRAA